MNIYRFVAPGCYRSSNRSYVDLLCFLFLPSFSLLFPYVSERNKILFGSKKKGKLLARLYSMWFDKNQQYALLRKENKEHAKTRRKRIKKRPFLLGSSNSRFRNKANPRTKMCKALQRLLFCPTQTATNISLCGPDPVTRRCNYMVK